MSPWWPAVLLVISAAGVSSSSAHRIFRPQQTFTFTIEPSNSQPLRSVPFAVVVPQPLQSVGIVNFQQDCTVSTPAEGGDFISTSAGQQAWFIMTAPVGMYTVCVTAPNGVRFEAGSFELSAITFTPTLVFKGQRVSITFSNHTPSNTEVAVSARISCGSYIYGPVTLVGRATPVMLESTTGGYFCVKVTDPRNPSGSLMVNVGRILVSDPITFHPLSGLRYDTVAMEFSLPAARGEVAFATTRSCTAPFELGPYTLQGEFGTEVSFRITAPVGEYAVCVAVPGVSGQYIPCNSLFRVTSYSFSPTTIIAGTPETLTMGGSVATPQTNWKLDSNPLCNSATPILGPRLSTAYKINLEVATAGAYIVCIQKPPPFQSVYLNSGVLTVTEPFLVVPQGRVVRGMPGKLLLRGGTPPDSLVKLAASEDCAGSVLSPQPASGGVVTFTFAVTPKKYYACAEPADRSRWVKAGEITVQPYQLAVHGALLVARDVKLTFDSATPVDGLNLTFARRGVLVTNACLLLPSDDAISVFATPVLFGTVQLPEAGTWDLCTEDNPSLLLSTVEVVDRYTFLPRDAVLDTVVVLRMGPSVPTATGVTVVPKGADCRAAVGSAVVDSDRAVYLNLSQTGGFRNGTSYEVCVDSKALAPDAEWIRTEGTLTLHAMRTTPFVRAVANLTSTLQLEGWPLVWKPSYTTAGPPVRETTTHRVLLVRGMTGDRCEGGAGDLSYGTTDLQRRVGVLVEEANINVTVCVAIEVSPYLRGKTVNGTTFHDPPIAWLKAGQVTVAEPPVIIAPPPSPDDLAPAARSPADGPPTPAGLQLIRYVPFSVQLAGGALPGTPVMVSRDESCSVTATGGGERPLGEDKKVVFTIDEPTGTVYLCSLPAGDAWVMTGEIDVREVLLQPPRDVFIGGVMPRELTLTNAGVLDAVSLMKADYCIADPSQAISYELPVSRRGTFDLKLPSNLPEGLWLLCGHTKSRDFLPIRPRVESYAMPQATMGAPRRHLPWRVELPVGWGGSIVRVVKYTRENCGNPSTAVTAVGGQERVVQGTVVTFNIDEPSGTEVTVCLARNNSARYFATAGSRWVEGLLFPRTFPRNEPSTAILPVLLPDPSQFKLAQVTCNESFFTPITMSTVITPEGPVSAASFTSSLPTALVCIRSMGLSSHRRAAPLSHLNLTEVDRVLNGTPWLPVGTVNTVPPFSFTASPIVVPPGDELTVKVERTAHMGNTMMLSNFTDCTVVLEGGEPRTASAALEATFVVPPPATSPIVVCMKTADGTNWIAASGGTEVVLLSYTFPLSSVRCCSQIPFPVPDLPVLYGMLSFSTSPSCSGAPLFPTTIDNGTAQVMIPVLLRDTLWTCLSGLPSGRVGVVPPPTSLFGSSSAIVGEPFHISLRHPSDPVDQMEGKVLAHPPTCSDDCCDGTPLFTFRGSGVLEVSNSTPERLVVCSRTPRFPESWVPVGSVTTRPFFDRGQQLGQVKEGVPFNLTYPSALYTPPKTWVSSLRKENCSGEDVGERRTTPPSGLVTHVLRSYAKKVVVCANTTAVNTTTGTPLEPTNATVWREVAAAEVEYTWNFSIAPTHGTALYKSPFRVGGNAPGGARVFLQQPSVRCSGGPPPSLANAVAGNASSTSGLILVIAPEGVWEACVEVYPNSADYVSAGVVSFDAVGAEPTTPLSACLPSLFTIEGLGSDTSANITLVPRVEPHSGACCANVPGLPGLPPTHRVLQGNVSMTQGLALRVEFNLSGMVGVPLVLCTRNATHCYEAAYFPSGARNESCGVTATPSPTAAGLGIVLGGAVDQGESEDIEVGELVGVVVGVALALVLLLLCCWWWWSRHLDPVRKKKKKVRGKSSEFTELKELGTPSRCSTRDLTLNNASSIRREQYPLLKTHPVKINAEVFEVPSVSSYTAQYYTRSLVSKTYPSVDYASGQGSLPATPGRYSRGFGHTPIPVTDPLTNGHEITHPSKYLHTTYPSADGSYGVHAGDTEGEDWGHPNALPTPAKPSPSFAISPAMRRQGQGLSGLSRGSAFADDDRMRSSPAPQDGPRNGTSDGGVLQGWGSDGRYASTFLRYDGDVDEGNTVGQRVSTTYTAEAYSAAAWADRQRTDSFFTSAERRGTRGESVIARADSTLTHGWGDAPRASMVTTERPTGGILRQAHRSDTPPLERQPPLDDSGYCPDRSFEHKCSSPPLRTERSPTVHSQTLPVLTESSRPSEFQRRVTLDEGGGVGSPSRPRYAAPSGPCDGGEDIRVPSGGLRGEDRESHSMLRDGGEDRERRSVLRDGGERSSVLRDGGEDRERRSVLRDGGEDRERRSVLRDGGERSSVIRDAALLVPPPPPSHERHTSDGDSPPTAVPVATPVAVLAPKETSGHQHSGLSPLMRNGTSPLLHGSPSPLMRDGPSPLLHGGPSPLMHGSPSPLMRDGPSPLLHGGPSPLLHGGPSPLMQGFHSPLVPAPPGHSPSFSPCVLPTSPPHPTLHAAVASPTYSYRAPSPHPPGGSSEPQPLHRTLSVVSPSVRPADDSLNKSGHSMHSRSSRGSRAERLAEFHGQERVKFGAIEQSVRAEVTTEAEEEWEALCCDEKIGRDQLRAAEKEREALKEHNAILADAQGRQEETMQTEAEARLAERKALEEALRQRQAELEVDQQKQDEDLAREHRRVQAELMEQEEAQRALATKQAHIKAMEEEELAREKEEERVLRARLRAEEEEAQAAARKDLFNDEAAARGRLVAEEESDHGLLFGAALRDKEAVNRLASAASSALKAQRDAEQRERITVLLCEEDARVRIADTEETMRRGLAASLEGVIRKTEQVEALLKEQQSLLESKQQELTRHKQTEEEGQMILDESKRKLAEERERLEKERLALETFTRAQEEAAQLRRTEMLQRQAEEELRLQQDQALLAEREALIREHEARVRDELEAERARLARERAEVMEEMKRVEDERTAQRQSAFEEERRKQEEAVLEQEAKHEEWMRKVKTMQEEVQERQELEVEAWKEWDVLVLEGQAAITAAYQAEVDRRAAEKRKQARLDMRATHASSSLDPSCRMKDACVELLKTLTVLTNISSTAAVGESAPGS